MVPLTEQSTLFPKGWVLSPPFSHPPCPALLSIAAWPDVSVPSTTDYRPQGIPGAMPDLPAYVLFLCIQHADHCHDEPRCHSLLDAAINAIKRVMKVLGAGKLLGDMGMAWDSMAL